MSICLYAKYNAGHASSMNYSLTWTSDNMFFKVCQHTIQIIKTLIIIMYIIIILVSTYLILIISLFTSSILCNISSHSCRNWEAMAPRFLKLFHRNYIFAIQILPYKFLWPARLECFAKILYLTIIIKHGDYIDHFVVSFL